ncbi:glycoside hydrolase superfamily [Lasiosphaeria ovina]|uniref:non-reducing end alpha-L-arabinofuranosidase n=1 Tax=Lasiosphaeria ovina TaxID=92902 RepID=A0AAE0KHH1_9PEZI|nr:glycoside hydrolase superfamily [Lasiosphaeria ovina]
MSVSLFLAVAALLPWQAAAVDLFVRSTGGNASSPIMYGFMHEDINNSGDGGIYAELIRNRAFQGSAAFPASLDGWSSVGLAALTLQQRSPQASPLSAALPNWVRVTATPSQENNTTTAVGLANAGFWGMDVRVQNYTGSFFARGAYAGAFTASLQSALTGELLASVQVPSKLAAGKGNGWTEHAFTLIPGKAAANSNNSFAITFDAAGLDGETPFLDFNLISLFPPTYKNRANGLRIDIAEAIAELKPRFLRFPGGNMLEGDTLTTFWKWNETIGPLKDRPGMAGVWKYPLTTGLGLVEYMQWCDDMELEPILAVWDGLALDGTFVPQSQISEAVQFALDEIEFLTGDAATTKWGAARAALLGHAAPWRIRYVEIGNEDWLAGRPTAYDSYRAYRFEAFATAFGRNYPAIQLIASPSVFDDMVIPAPAAGDYHPYLTPDEFVARFGKFDALTTQNQTLIGEVAAVHPNGGLGWADGNTLMANPWWGGSVSEGIFMIGAERNGDKVIGAAYAPGLRNLNRWQWGMTLLQHAADPALTTRSTSWYLLASHEITHTLPVTDAAGSGVGPLYHVAGAGKDGQRIFKAGVYNTTQPVAVAVRFEGVAAASTATLTVLSGPDDAYGFNDPFTRVNVVNETTSTMVAGKDGVFAFSLPRLSIAVLETAAEKRVGSLRG